MTPHRTTFRALPSSDGIAYQPVTLTSPDGLKLAGWYVPAATRTDKGIVLFHGHGSDKDRIFEKFGRWLHSRYNLFVYDSRYHGQSQGTFTTLGYFERQDALGAIAELRRRGSRSIGLMGESMGGAVAIEAAALDPSVRAVVDDCAFDSLHDAIAPRAIKQGYPLADLLADVIVWTAGARAHAPLAEADPIRWVAKIAPRPLLIIHGQADDETPPVNSEKLYAAARAPKEIWRTAGARHGESHDLYPAEYERRVLAFFGRSL